MKSFRSFFDSGGRRLADRLEHLSQTLGELAERVRAAMTHAVGETVAGVVRDTLRHFLDDPPSAWSPRPEPLPPPSRSFWHDPEDDWDDPHHRSDPFEEDEDELRHRVEPAPADPLNRLSSAAAAGLQAAAWWLRRWSGSGRPVTTLAIGLVAAGTAYVGGVLARGLQLIQSIGQLSRLTSVLSLHRF